ncbi:GreA/GreB family elongation factor [Acanthopleuribacter pedis]|uniref:Transcription elongation factor GreA n=1 Tax=Acanthopleuribacter pedis TaxID=442870 RepID=A0A8J7U4D9_9BACT|nr:transcription elongation factor GreA [Acanthopleuribacter pedis]MBO1318186.1 transcription elongation factor GreA [Acanthopleuribacter pedis]
MTKKLLSRLNEDLRELEHELKTKLPEEIRKAAALGDLSENAEYEAALDRQRLIQSKYRSLKNRINEIAQVDVDRLPMDTAGYGSRVTVLDIDTDKEITYQLVMPEDAEAKMNRISISSPIGRALMGKRVEDEVGVTIPSGKKTFEIMDIVPYKKTEMNL